MTAAEDVPPLNPFVGPVPFFEEGKLHGRDVECSALYDLIVAKRVVLLFSPSGAGKTSLIHAALLPRLRAKLDTLAVARVNRAPGTGEGSANRYVLSVLHSLETRFDEADRIAASELIQLTLRSYLERRVSRTGPRPRYPLVVLDQFEELFTADRYDWPAKRDFLRQLGEALGRQDAPEGDEESGLDAEASRATVWALISMREDHLAELEPFLDLVPTGLAFRYRLEPLDREHAIEAITKTASEGFDRPYFDQNAAEALVDDLRGGSRFVEPVHLQVVCLRLWNVVVSKERRPIAMADVTATDRYTSTGTVDAALAAHYDDAVAAAAAAGHVRERSVREWIERNLITGTKIRTKALREPEELGDLYNALESLLQNHVLNRETEGDRQWVELSHDRLIDPVLQSNETWREKSLALFQQQTKLWSEAGRTHRGMLFSGDALEEAERFAEAHPDDLTGDDREFLKESRLERERLDENRRQEEQLRAANESLKLGRKRLVRAVAATAIVAVLLMLISAGLLNARREVVAQRDEAKKQARARQEALVASQVLALSEQAREQGPSQDSALLLTVQAKRFADRVSARTAEAMPTVSRSKREGPFYALAESLSGAQAASSGVGFLARLMPEMEASRLASDGSGAGLATGDLDGTVTIWRRAGETYQRTDSRKLMSREVGRLAMTGSGQWLAATALVHESDSSGGELWVLEISVEGRILSAQQLESTLVTAVAAGSGETEQDPLVVTGDLRGKVRFWRRDEGFPTTWSAHDLGDVSGGVFSLAVGRGGATIFAGGEGPIGRWSSLNLSTGEALRRSDLEGHQDGYRVRSLALSADETVLWSAGALRGESSSAGGLLRWSLPGREPTTEPKQYPTSEFIAALTLVEDGMPPIAATMYSGRLLRYEPAELQGIPRIAGAVDAHPGGVTALVNAGPGHGFLSAGRDRRVKRWVPVPAVRCPEGVPFGEWRVGGLAVLPLGERDDWVLMALHGGRESALQLIHVGSSDGSLDISGDGGCVAPPPVLVPPRLPGVDSLPLSFAVEPRSRLAAISTSDSQVLLYRVVTTPSGAPRLELRAQLPQVAALALAFLPDQPYLLAGQNGKIAVLKFTENTLEIAGGLPAPQGRVNLLTASPDWVAAGTRDADSVAIWAREPSARQQGPLGGLRRQEFKTPAIGGRSSALTFSRDGRVLWRQLQNGAVTAWEAGSWREVANAPDNTPASAFAISPNGTLVAAGHLSGRLQFADLPAGEAAARSQGAPAARIQWSLDRAISDRRVSSLAFTTDGGAIVAASFDNRLRVVPTLSTLMDRLCARAGRNLTKGEWDLFVGREMPYECTCGQFPAGQGAQSCGQGNGAGAVPVK